MEALLKKIGIQVDDYTVNYYFNKVDKDRSKAIDYDEFR